MGATDISPRADSVRFTASTQSFRDSAFENNSDRSVPFGGVSSAVTTKSPASTFSTSVLTQSLPVTAKQPHDKRAPYAHGLPNLDSVLRAPSTSDNPAWLSRQARLLISVGP